LDGLGEREGCPEEPLSEPLFRVIETDLFRVTLTVSETLLSFAGLTSFVVLLSKKEEK